MMRPYYPVSGPTRRHARAQSPMARVLAGAALAGLVAMSLLASELAHAAGPVVRFDGGIGSQPLRAGGLVNDALGVPPGGRPWVIEHLTADVSSDGQIRVDGRGLLLAGGAVATNGGQSVRARVFCNGVAAGDSELVALDERGDFRIGGFLNPIPPSPCTNPTLLIVNANGAWFAAGIPKR